MEERRASFLKRIQEGVRAYYTLPHRDRVLPDEQRIKREFLEKRASEQHLVFTARLDVIGTEVVVTPR